MNDRNLVFVVATALLFASFGALAAGADDPQRVAAAGSGIWATAARSILSLGAVLAVLGACAWAAKRLRDGGHLKGGLIQVVSGISLGGREKVVLLRVGDEEVLVGVSPAGMAPLHVLGKPTHTGTASKSFAEYMDEGQ